MNIPQTHIYMCMCIYIYINIFIYIYMHIRSLLQDVHNHIELQGCQDYSSIQCRTAGFPGLLSKSAFAADLCGVQNANCARPSANIALVTPSLRDTFTHFTRRLRPSSQMRRSSSKKRSWWKGICREAWISRRCLSFDSAGRITEALWTTSQNFKQGLRKGSST